MVRYILAKDVRVTVLAEPKKSKKLKEFFPGKENIYVDILEITEDWLKVRVFHDSEIIVGWIVQATCPIDLSNKEELFDGRFNSDRVT